MQDSTDHRSAAVATLASAVDWHVAIVIEPELGVGRIANTAAVIAIGLGAARPQLGNERLSDAARHGFFTSANRPVPLLQASRQRLSELLLAAWSAPADVIVVPFPSFARELHEYAEYLAQVARVDLSQEPLDGIGLAGTKKWVRSLTGALKLLR